MRSWEDRLTVWTVRVAAITDDLTTNDPAKLTELQTALRPTLADLAPAIQRGDGPRVEQLTADADRIIDNVVPNWTPTKGLALQLHRIHRAHA